jgi:hypothetical protein
MTNPSEARTRLMAALRVDPEAAADALLLALLALLALKDAADVAGDATLWNEDGAGYEAIQRINALLDAPPSLD